MFLFIFTMGQSSCRTRRFTTFLSSAIFTLVWEYVRTNASKSKSRAGLTHYQNPCVNIWVWVRPEIFFLSGRILQSGAKIQCWLPFELFPVEFCDDVACDPTEIHVAVHLPLRGCRSVVVRAFAPILQIALFTSVQCFAITKVCRVLRLPLTLRIALFIAVQCFAITKVCRVLRLRIAVWVIGGTNATGHVSFLFALPL